MSAAPRTAADGPQARVLTLLDEARGAQAVLDVSTTLAQLLQRDWQVVYVESAAALAAAGLPATQALGAASARWAPLAPADVERGWHAEAARLRAMAANAALHRSVRWSMQVTRGALAETVQRLLPQSDLLLVGGTAAFCSLPAATLRCRSVTALDDGSPEGDLAGRIAARLAASLGVGLRRRAPGMLPAGDGAAAADLLVLPRALHGGPPPAVAQRLATLLVGATGRAGAA